MDGIVRLTWDRVDFKNRMIDFGLPKTRLTRWNISYPQTMIRSFLCQVTSWLTMEV